MVPATLHYALRPFAIIGWLAAEVEIRRTNWEQRHPAFTEGRLVATNYAKMIAPFLGLIGLWRVDDKIQNLREGRRTRR